MNPRHADVVDPIDPVPEVLENDRGLLSHRQIGSTGRHYPHWRSLRLRVRPGLENSAGGVVAQLFKAIEQRFRAIFLETRHEDFAMGIEATFDDDGKLLVGLAGCEDRLRHAGAAFTVGVEACKTKILNSSISQAIGSLVNTELTRGDRFQYLLNFFSVQQSSIGCRARSDISGRGERAVYLPIASCFHKSEGHLQVAG
jgi:hypothetical protein